MSLRNPLFLVLFLTTPSFSAITGLAGTSERPRVTLEETSQQVITLNGRLLSDQGSVLSRPVAVTLECGQVRMVTFSSPTGEFTFSFGPSSSDVVGASLGPVGLGCLIHVNNPDMGFVNHRFSIASKSGGIVDVGVVALEPPPSSTPPSEPTVHVSSLRLPAKAVKAVDSARKHMAAEPPRYQKARKDVEKALKLESQYAEAWNLLGVIERADGNDPEARSAFEKARSQDPRLLWPHLFLAELETQEGRWEVALDHIEDALAIDPESSRAHYLRAFAAFNVGRLREAEVSCRRVLESPNSSRYKDLLLVHGYILESQGLRSEASLAFQEFIDANPRAPQVDSIRQKLQAWRQQGPLQSQPPK